MTSSGGTRSTTPARKSGGGRGALEPREDPISAYWTLAVAGLFALVLVLSFLGLPSRLLEAATPSVTPSVPGSPSVSIPTSPSIEVIPPSSVTPTPTGSPATSPAASPSPTPDPDI